MSKKSCKPQFLMGAMAPGILLYAPCCNNKKKKNQEKIKKWISWDIQFKENNDDQKKLKAITEVQKQIIEHLYSQDWQGLLKSICFSFKPNPGIKNLPNHIHMNVKLKQQNLNLSLKDVEWVQNREGVKPPPPPPPPPAYRPDTAIKNIDNVLSGNEILH